MHLSAVITATAIVAAAASITSAVPRAHPRHPFDRFFVIVLENTEYRDAMSDPYLGGSLLQKGRLLTNYRAITHPSQPNYIAMVSGSTREVADNAVHDVNAPSLADTLSLRHVSWAAYNEHYPEDQGCFANASTPDLLYRRKHNGFMSFTHVNGNERRCTRHIKSLNAFYSDVENHKVPEYVFFTPNMLNGGHDTNVTYAASWLEGFISPLLQNAYFKRTLFVVTFDENDKVDPSNQVYTLLIGSGVTVGTTDDTAYTHYSQLATVEARWGLPWLTENDRNATPFQLD